MIKSKKILHVDSRQRISGIDSDFSIKLPIPPNSNFDKVCVLNYAIPKSYYLIDVPFNTFVFNGQTRVVTPGNYTITQLLNELKTVMGINITVDLKTGKYFFSGTGTLLFDSESMYEVMGFSPGTYSCPTVSPNICNFQSESTLFLHSTCCETSDDNVLIEIFAGAQPTLSSVVKNEVVNIEAFSRDFKQNESNLFHFKLTDESGRVMNLNGVNIVFTLLLWKKSPVVDMSELFLKMLAYRDS